MYQNQKIQLQLSSCRNIPFEVYDNIFCFFINGTKIETKRIVADILSPVISHQHTIDPSVNTFTINTKTTGDFKYILDLIFFSEIEVPDDQLPFVIEMCKILDIKTTDLISPEYRSKLTIDNIFSNIKFHEQYPTFFQNRLTSEVEFVSQHFYQIYQNHKQEFLHLSMNSIIAIINNQHLVLNSEDELLEFVNFLCENNYEDYCCLYEYVHFVNVSKDSVHNFLQHFQIEYMTQGIWQKLSKRLDIDIHNTNKAPKNSTRYFKAINKGRVFSYSSEQKWNGIFNHFKQQIYSIKNYVNITASNIGTPKDTFDPSNVIDYENRDVYFHSENYPNSWISFEFEQNSVIPSHYTIQSYNPLFSRS